MMTTLELIQIQLSGAGKQLNQLISVMSEENGDFKSSAMSMSPRETLEHLCEVYTAVLEMVEGKDHNWGSYVAPDTTIAGLSSTLNELREKAVSACLTGDAPQIETATHFIVEHDFYHVGQLVTCMMLSVRDFDPYMIYKS